jgi:hypothetical protein
MSKKAELVNVQKRIGSPESGSALFELCKWCTWYQKLEVKTLFGIRVKKPYKNFSPIPIEKKTFFILDEPSNVH